VSEQLADERATAAPAPGQVGGQAVMLSRHRTPDMEETMLPPDYQRILATVRQAAGPVMARRSATPWESMSACGPSWSLCAEAGQTGRPQLAAQTADGRFTTRL